ncbi:PTS lactose/cellobiose transporter subunit IIA [Halanaerobacter jeridensis]|uniref:PTS system cellobiose-specific IIA component n=1 Tax=Halanaerobacter jeridensis TaxID=706427 RepID=A0A938XTB0_9FIRM|nr:PTS lactose/cellobiose transporter subunit IIA [Halanaerobacter jeridensis]MBM7557356.1 PTS system cellobiose-specific IIA component [Halanaerobacter jeridensis]
MAPKEVNLEQVSFKITLHAGNAKELAHDALTEAKKGNYQKADELIEEAHEEYAKGHDIQSENMSKDDPKQRVMTNMLLAHAMDHLMSANTEISLIEEMIELHKE